MASNNLSKRVIEPAERNTHSDKRAKPNSIMNYMKPIPHSHRKRSGHEGSEGSSLKTIIAADEDTSDSFPARSDGESDSESNRKEKATSSINLSKSPYFRNSQSSDVDDPTRRHPDEYPNTPSPSLPDNVYPTLKLTEHIGDIFDAPKGTLIIHSCNCQGSWGAGIAAAFRKKYLAAYGIYAAHCKKYNNGLFGKGFLIPPSKSDGQGHFVGCLFTSRFFGKKKDTPKKILSMTKPAMEDLMKQVWNWNDEHDDEGEKILGARMCMINSGLFGVPWDKTMDELEKIELEEGDIKVVQVISRATS